MASIKRLAANRFKVSGRVRINGKLVQRHRTVATRDEAEAYRRDFERLYEQRGVAAPAQRTVGELIARYLAARKDDTAATTWDGYARNLNYLNRELGGIRVERVTPQHCDEAFSAILAHGGKGGAPLAAQTVRHVRRVAHHMFKEAQRWTMRTDNPVALSKPVKVPVRRVQPYTLAQVDALLRLAPEPLAEMVYILATVGLRRSEVLGVPWRLIDLDQATLRVEQVCEQAGQDVTLRLEPKTESAARTIALDSVQVAMLRRWRTRLIEQCLQLRIRWEDSRALCFPDLATGDCGRPFVPNRISARFGKLARKAGVPRGTNAMHGLRHFHASQLVHLPTRLLADRLGHVDPRFTARVYQHGDADTARETAEAGRVRFATLSVPGRTNGAN